MFSVYIFTFLNGKRYVGKMKTNGNRWANHLSAANRLVKYQSNIKRGIILSKTEQEDFVVVSKPLYRVINKYEWKNISKKTISGLTEAEAFFLEKFLIVELKSYIHWGMGYNLTLGGEGTSGWVPSQKTRNKIGDALRGKSRHPLTAEHRGKISVSNKGKPKPPRTAKHCENLSAALVGRKLSPEHCASISAGNTGRVQSEKTRKQISATQKGRPKSPEMRKKLRETKGKRRAENIAAVKAMLADRMSQMDVSKATGIPRGTISRWVQ